MPASIDVRTNNNNNTNNRKRVYSTKYRKKVLMLLGSPYYALERIDRCTTITISIPVSLDYELEKYLSSDGISKSRYIRKLIEKDLGLYYQV